MNTVKKMEDYSSALRKSHKESQFKAKRVCPLISYSVDTTQKLTEVNTLITPPEIPLNTKLTYILKELQTSDYQYLKNILLLIRRILSKAELIEQAIKLNYVIYLSKIFDCEDKEVLINLMWLLTNITAESSEAIRQIRELKVQYKLLEILNKEDEEIKEQCIWLIANITADSVEARNEMLEDNIAEKLCYILSLKGVKERLLKVICWEISNLCKGKPPPEFEKVKKFVVHLSNFLYYEDEQLVSDALWALLSLTDRERTAVKYIAHSINLKQVSSFITHKNQLIKKPALIILGNITIGDKEDVETALNSDCLTQLAKALRIEKYSELLVDICWVISSIAADIENHNDLFISLGITENLISLTRTIHSKSVKKEAFFALKNMIKIATNEQVTLILKQGLLSAVIDWLEVSDPDFVSILLDILDAVIDINNNALEFELLGGKAKLEYIQLHGNIAFYKRSLSLLKKCYEQTECAHNKMELDELISN